MESLSHSMMDDELVAELRRSASIWFKNTDLLALEELIMRYYRCKIALANAVDTLKDRPQS